jgi:glutathione S-transferase
LASEAKGRGFDPRQSHQIIAFGLFAIRFAQAMALRPLLYTYRRCPYAIRARMALLQAEIAFDAYEIVLRDKPPAMLAASPKGTVPVLVLPDGPVIEQSLDIMQWALLANDREGWWDRSQTAGSQAWVALNDGAFKQHLDRYKYPEKFGTADRAIHREQAMSGLIEQLEEHLSKQTFLGGVQPCAADAAIFPFIRQFRAFDVAWFDAQPIQATQRWLKHWLTSTLFADCMKKLPANTRTTF